MNYASVPPSNVDASISTLSGDPELLKALRDDASHHPHAVLGAHPARSGETNGAVVRAFHPDAIACSLIIGSESRPISP